MLISVRSQDVEGDVIRTIATKIFTGKTGESDVTALKK